MNPPTLILASQSRGRAFLLQQAGYAFRQASPAFSDPPQPQVEDHVPPQRHAVDLAVRKAESLRDILGDHVPGSQPVVILSADTMCVAAGRMISQPIDIDDARTMIRSFVGRRHDVVSGVALLRVDPSDAVHFRRGGELVVLEDTVPVTFGAVSDDEIESYLATGQWKGKAGAYSLLERQAAGWPITIPADADATTVIGLPMRKVIAALARWGLHGKQKSEKAEKQKIRADPRRP